MILLTYGTRPEFIKLMPLIEVFEEVSFPYKLLHTGQHDSLAQFNWDYKINIVHESNKNRLDNIIAHVTKSGVIDDILKTKNIELILVQGDTASAFAVALSAFHHGIRVVHLEAGLRTYDSTPWPEENYRRMISHIASIHLCPTQENKNNLLNENVKGDCYVVGNTVIDNLVPYLDKLEYGNQVLVTLHRRENNKLFKLLCSQIEELAIEHPELEFIFPMHPSPEIRKHADVFTKVKVVDPMPYEEMLNTLAKVRMVITDSGGIQEECSFFNKKCIVCRRTTERQESVGKSSFLVEDDIKTIFDAHVNNFEINYLCPYGDGLAAPRILKILSNYMNGN